MAMLDISVKDNKTDLLKVAKDTAKSFPGGMVPEKFDEWWSHVQNAKKDIRKQLGGVARFFQVNKPNRNGNSHFNIPPKEMAEYAEALGKIICTQTEGSYLKQYNCNTYTLRLWLCAGYTPKFLTKGGDQKITRHISKWMARKECPLTKEKKAEVEKILADVGQKYVEMGQKQKAGEFRCAIHTGSRAFFLMGMFGESGYSSCWKHGSIYDCSINRYRAAMIPNSFIFLVSRQNIEDAEKNTCVARCLGYLYPKAEEARLGNGYYRDIYHTDVQAMAAECIGELFGKKEMSTTTVDPKQVINHPESKYNLKIGKGKNVGYMYADSLCFAVHPKDRKVVPSSNVLSYSYEAYDNGLGFYPSKGSTLTPIK